MKSQGAIFCNINCSLKFYVFIFISTLLSFLLETNSILNINNALDIQYYGTTKYKYSTCNFLFLV